MGLFGKKDKKQGAPAAKNVEWASWTCCADVQLGDVFDFPGCWFALQVIEVRRSETTVSLCNQTGTKFKKEKRRSAQVLLKAIKKIPVRYLESRKTQEYAVRRFPMPDCFEEGVYDARFAADYFCEGHWNEVWGEIDGKRRCILPVKADASGDSLPESIKVRFCLFPRERLDFLRGFAQGIVNHDRVLSVLGGFEPRNGGYKISGPAAVDLERCDYMRAPWMAYRAKDLIDPKLHAVTRQMYLDDDKPVERKQTSAASGPWFPTEDEFKLTAGCFIDPVYGVQIPL